MFGVGAEDTHPGIVRVALLEESWCWLCLGVDGRSWGDVDKLDGWIGRGASVKLSQHVSGNFELANYGTGSESSDRGEWVAGSSIRTGH